MTTYDVIRTKILWTLKIVISHYSFNSATDTFNVFSKMIPDSNIAKEFRCEEHKHKLNRLNHVWFDQMVQLAQEDRAKCEENSNMCP